MTERAASCCIRLMVSGFLLSFMDWSAVVVHDWAKEPLTMHIKMTTHNPEEQYRIPKYTDSLLKLFQITEFDNGLVLVKGFQCQSIIEFALIQHQVEVRQRTIFP